SRNAALGNTVLFLSMFPTHNLYNGSVVLDPASRSPAACLALISLIITSHADEKRPRISAAFFGNFRTWCSPPLYGLDTIYSWLTPRCAADIQRKLTTKELIGTFRWISI